MGSAGTEYAAFKEKVRRTVYIDNLSPDVTESVLKNGLDQFVTINSIQFIPIYEQPNIISKAALVEMKDSTEAKNFVRGAENLPLMMAGMPRPVRALPAEEEMFDDRPRKPGRKIHCRWVDPKDPSFEVYKEIKDLVKKHAAEAQFMLEQQLAEEEKLAHQQEQVLKGSYKKFGLTDSVFADGTVKRLARRYNMQVSDT